MYPKVFGLTILCFCSFAFGQIEKATQTITPEGGKIELDICGYAEFPEGFLKEDAEISFSCSDVEETYYPENFDAEIRCKTDDGTELFGIDQYSASRPVETGIASSQVIHIRLSELAILVDDYDTQIITISIIPVAPEDLINAGPSHR